MIRSLDTECPPPAELRKLLDPEIAGATKDQLVAHLDGCEKCQQSLEFMASGSSGFIDVARDLDRDRPEDTSAFWPVLGKLKQELARGGAQAMAQTRDGRDAMAPTVLPADVSLDFLDPPEQPNTLGKLGRFHVVGLIGRGGMGMVLRGLDVCLQRQVALKVLDPQYAKNEVARGRFIREARAAAQITHENVVSVHHVEKHREDIPFLVMRLVAGESLQDLLDREGALLVRDIVHIGQQIAAGLSAAHEKGLIHRDIKPANILIEASNRRVLLTDFGLARAVEDSKLTQTGFVAGTPLYMSPEQARGEALDHRSDIFSFGSVLYAMATGKPPFQGTSPFVVLREVTEARHHPVQQLNSAIPTDVATLIDRLLEKDPAQRIQSAAEVAEILSAILVRLDGGPAAEACALHTARLLSAAHGSRWKQYLGKLGLWILGLNVLLFGLELAGVTQLTVLGQRGSQRQVPVEPPARSEPSPSDMSQFVLASSGPIGSVALSPDGNLIAMGSDDGTIKLWHRSNGRLKATLDKAHAGVVTALAFDRDGSYLASAGEDGLVHLWEVRTLMEVHFFHQPHPVYAVVFSPDGKQIATGARNGSVRIWDAKTGESVASTRGHDVAVNALTYSPDGKLLASASDDRTAKIWDARTGENTFTLSGHQGRVHAIAFHPDNQMLATGSWDQTIRLWDVSNGEHKRTFQGGKAEVTSLAFAAGGQWLIAGDEDRTVTVWDTQQGKVVKRFTGHNGAIEQIAASTDGHTLISGSRDGTIRIWEYQP